VTSLAGGGYAVREFTRAEIDDAIELRGALEGTAARFAAERLESESELDELRSVVARLDEAVHDPSPDALAAYVELNEAFHAELVALAKSELLARELAHVLAVPFASPAAVRLSSRELLLVAQHQHRALVDAIGARQGARAEEVAREHARSTRQSLELALERGDALDGLPALLELSAQPER
jgi:GntR family transcriptional regulator of vanillate catabolism